MIEVKYPVLMSKEDLEDLIKKMDALEHAFYDFSEAWGLAPHQVQDILNDVSNRHKFPFNLSLDEQAAEFGGWADQAREDLREQTCQSCNRIVEVGRGENYRFIDNLGHDVCNECADKMEVEDMGLYNFYNKENGEFESRQRMSKTEATLRAKRKKLKFEEVKA